MPAYPEHGETADERDARLRSYRYPGGPSTYASPQVEPFASRLERAQREDWCTYQTRSMLDDLGEVQPGWRFVDSVWVKGICVPFLAFAADAGIFLVWSFDGRWSPQQAALVAPARRQIQLELGPEFPGQVEVIFHIPPIQTGWHRHVLVDEEAREPIDIIAIGGRIDRVLATWSPAGEVGLDPLWIEWICRAAQPRWWRSAEGMQHSSVPPRSEEI